MAAIAEFEDSEAVELLSRISRIDTNGKIADDRKIMMTGANAGTSQHFFGFTVENVFRGLEKRLQNS